MIRFEKKVANYLALIQFAYAVIVWCKYYTSIVKFGIGAYYPAKQELKLPYPILYG